MYCKHSYVPWECGKCRAEIEAAWVEIDANYPYAHTLPVDELQCDSNGTCESGGAPIGYVLYADPETGHDKGQFIMFYVNTITFERYCEDCHWWEVEGREEERRRRREGAK